ncbi:uncharacterized protein LOC113281161 [Papaver somniferum]|uniref:uncharacterized protein LOC113281161 n=1 Tax=Papaver somniferum TaxID=3469 RepID=UPI000E6FF746|nr:uncharacterized protein LOC113281161 [Papaver somniferum]
MDMEDDDESLYSREEVSKNYMEFQQEVALIQPLPQKRNYSLCLPQGESSKSSPLSSVPHQMNQPSADQQLYRVPQQTQQLLSQPWGALVQGIPLRISENVPQNVPSQLQRQLSAPYIQQSTSSSLRAPTSSSQRMSSTGRALQRASTPQQREAWGQLLGRPPVQHIPQNVPSELQQLAAPSHSQQAASSSLREAPSSQQGMSSTTGEAINRAWQNLTRQEREELFRQTWNRLPDTSHVQNLLHRFPDRPSVQDILQRTSQRVPHIVIPQLQQQLAAPSHGQQATSSSLRVATSSQQGISSTTGEAINRAWQNLTRQEREELLCQTWRGLPDTSQVQNLLQPFPDRPSVQDILQRTSERVPHSVTPQLQQLASPSYGQHQQAASSSLRAATSSQQGTSSSTGTPPTSTTDTI